MVPRQGGRLHQVGNQLTNHSSVIRRNRLRLHPKPSIAHGFLAQIIRWFAFRKFPALRALHERDLAAREMGLGVAAAQNG